MVSSAEAHLFVVVAGLVLSPCRLPAKSSENDDCFVGAKSMFSSEGMHGVVAAAKTMLPPANLVRLDDVLSPPPQKTTAKEEKP